MDPKELEELLYGVREPKSEKEQHQINLAAQMLMAAKPARPMQSEESIDRTFERLMAVHKEISTEKEEKKRAVAPAMLFGTPRKRLVVAATSVAAAAAIAVGLILFLVVGKPAPAKAIAIARAQIGEMEVIDSEGTLVESLDGIEVFEKYTVATKKDSLATVTFNNDSDLRLDETSSVRIEKGSKDKVQVSYLTGSSYCRAAEGTEFLVAFDGVEATGRGGAFNVDKKDDAFRVISLNKEVLIEDSSAELTIAQGEQVLIEETTTVAILEKTPVTKNEINNDWFRYNKVQDEEVGADPGVLKDIPTAGPEVVVPPVEVPPTEQPQPQPQPKPAPKPQPSMGLTVSVTPTLNTLNWNIQNLTGYDTIAVLRSETTSNLAFPANYYVSSAPNIPYSDSAIRGGSTYYYRICSLANGRPIYYSNPVTAPVPLGGNVTLSGSYDGTQVTLSWSSQANFDVDSYVVCKSQTSAAPVFPPPTGDSAWVVTYSGPTGSTTDPNVSSGGTYYYRVGILKNSTAITYSNTLTVQVP